MKYHRIRKENVLHIDMHWWKLVLWWYQDLPCQQKRRVTITDSNEKNLNSDSGFCILFSTKQIIVICLDNYARSENLSMKNKSNTLIMVCINIKYMQGYLLSMVWIHNRYTRLYVWSMVWNHTKCIQLHKIVQMYN